MKFFRHLLLVAASAMVLGAQAEDKKGTVVEVVGLKATTPADWKEEAPSNRMRLAQFKLEKAKDDAEDAELSVFISPGGGGIDANLKRQVAKFKLADGVKPEDAIKEEKLKVAGYSAMLQDITGTFLLKAAPFDPNSKVTEKEKFRQLYCIFEDEDGKVVSFILVGPEKTIDKHKKAFTEFMTSFKK
jgi:hypothetical protein